MAAKTALRLGEAAGTLFANEVIVISHVIDDMLIRKYGRKDCHVIYNGVPSPDITDYPEYFGELGSNKESISSQCAGSYRKRTCTT